MPSFVGASVDEETPEPGIEPVDVSEPWKLAPRVDERFLDRILSALSVPKDQAGDGVQPVAGGRRQGLEGLVIAVPCRLHVVALHQLLRRLRDLDGRAITLRRTPEPDRSRIASRRLSVSVRHCVDPSIYLAAFSTCAESQLIIGQLGAPVWPPPSS